MRVGEIFVETLSLHKQTYRRAGWHDEYTVHDAIVAAADRRDKSLQLFL